jgi:hypothetical protein
MKKIITILAFSIVAIGVNAQTQVTSKVLGDKIWLMPGAYEISPTLVTMSNDTARSFSYLISFSRDTSATVMATSTVYNKNGGMIKSDVTYFAGSKYKKWAPLITALDAYIQTVYTRLVKQ